MKCAVFKACDTRKLYVCSKTDVRRVICVCFQTSARRAFVLAIVGLVVVGFAVVAGAGWYWEEGAAREERITLLEIKNKKLQRKRRKDEERYFDSVLKGFGFK